MLFLCSCGSNQGNTEKTSELSETVKNWCLNEYLANGKRNIWYDVKAKDGIIGKDNDILSIYVFQNGQVTVYTKSDAEQVFEDFTLGMVAKLTDDEIVDKLEEGNKKELQKELESCIASWEEGKGSGAEETLNFYKSYSIIGSQPNKYAIEIETDETGNATQTERVYYVDTRDENNYHDLDEDEVYNDDYILEQAKKVKETVNNPYASVSNAAKCVTPIGGTQIYDSKFAGFATDKEEYIFVTRTNDEMVFCLDSPNAKDIYVDASSSDIEKELLK